MIAGFKKKDLKRFFESGDGRKIKPDHRKRVAMILTMLNSAARLEDMKAPGLDFHPLKGELKGNYAVTVKKNWRITFTYDGKDFGEVDYLDYH